MVGLARPAPGPTGASTSKREDRSGTPPTGAIAAVRPLLRPGATGPGCNLLIAHSLGLHLLPESVLAEADAVVLLGSFSAFVPNGRAGRAVAAALQGMQAALGTDQELTMLERFLDKAASPHARSALPPSPLLQGLTVLGRQRLQAGSGASDALPNAANGLAGRCSCAGGAGRTGRCGARRISATAHR